MTIFCHLVIIHKKKLLRLEVSPLNRALFIREVCPKLNNDDNFGLALEIDQLVRR